MIHVVPGIKYWDMAAAEALLLARFGIATNKYGDMIYYDHKAKDKTI